jgi:Ala-tRNA(Pro) deacylase
MTTNQNALPSADAREAALMERLEALKIPTRTYSHAPVFTVEEARALRGALEGTHTKNLFLEDRKGGLWLVVAREELSIDLNALSKTLGCPRFSFGKPETMIATLRVAPGAVTPFALMNDTECKVRVIFDEGMRGDPLNFHPLRNDKTTAIALEDLLRFVAATGHAVRTLILPERGQSSPFARRAQFPSP